MKIRLSVLVLAMCAMRLFGEIVATDIVATPRYPWSDKVDVEYTISGTDDSAIKLYAFADYNGVRYYGGSFGKDCLTAGRHHVTWERPSNWPQGAARSVTFGVEVRAGGVGAESLYWAVDLQTGEQTFFDGIPNGGWDDSYKTTKLLLRRIEPGSVIVGRSKPVTLTSPFYIGVFEITQSQYSSIAGSNPSQNGGGKRPVESVSYSNIRGSDKGASWPTGTGVDEDSWLGKLEAKVGVGFDLPTEAQWEYACRAGTESSYNNGGSSVDDLKKLGRYYYNGFDGHGEYATASTTVGSYLPNAWGLYDMHGNVNEWCLDWYGDLDAKVEDDYAGPSEGSRRVSRGGHWWGDYSGCYSFARGDYRAPEDAYPWLGFRVVKRGIAVGGHSFLAQSETAVDFRTLSGDITTPAKLFSSVPFAKSWFEGAVAKIAFYDNGSLVGESADEIGTFVWEPAFGSHRLMIQAVDADGKVVGSLLHDAKLSSSAKVISAVMRKDDPTVMDIVFRVDSPFETANVRVLAFENGVRSFANVWRPQTFVDGTASNIGPAVPANKVLTLSWKAIDDLGAASQNVMVEILVEEANRPLPLSFVKIPAQGKIPAISVSPDVPTDGQIFNALLWLYADCDPALTLKDGVLSISDRSAQLQHVYEKMGLSVLDGDLLKAVNESTHQNYEAGVHAYRYTGQN